MPATGFSVYANYNRMWRMLASAMPIGWNKKKEEAAEGPAKKFRCNLCGATFDEPAQGDKLCTECYAQDTIVELIE